MSRTIYRSRNGLIFGVCRGIADTFDLSLFWIRAAFVVAFAITFFFPTGLIYLILALIMKLEPESSAYGNLGGSSGGIPRTGDRKTLLRQLKAKFDSLESRIRRMESHVTDRAYDWERRFRGE